jgi:plasmid stability protein
MKNITVTLDESVSRWVRVWAAKHNTSVSRMLGEMLHRRMLEDDGYNSAMQQFNARKPTLLRQSGEELPDRDSLHER